MKRLGLALAALVSAAAFAPTAAPAPAAPPSARPAAQHLTSGAPVCKRGYYKNASGNCVHSPSSDPTGATARCSDGTYSYSQHASGTCSHHGGVARWIHHP